MGPIVQSLIAADRRLSPHVTYRRSSFRLQLPEPIEDWLPSDDDQFNMNVEYAAMETRISASMNLTEDQLRNADPYRLAADATRRYTAMRDNFAATYGWRAPTPLRPPQAAHHAHVITNQAVEPGEVLAVPVAPGLRRAMRRTAPAQALADVPGQMLLSGAVVDQVVRQAARQEDPEAIGQFIARGVEPTDQVVVHADRLPNDIDLITPISKHWIDGKAKGSMRLQVLKSRGDPPPLPPTAWDRIMADEDAF